VTPLSAAAIVAICGGRFVLHERERIPFIRGVTRHAPTLPPLLCSAPPHSIKLLLTIRENPATTEKMV